jgi:ADP-ribose pyrophosphatase YjhB (NUDIX family)
MQVNDDFIEIRGDNYFGYYSNIRVACRGIVTRNDNILLVYARNYDVWMVPGGGLEEGENETSCVIREISEETGYVVGPTKCVLEIDEYYENEKYINKYFLCNIVGQSKAQLTEQEAKAGLESKWIPIKDAIDIFSKHQLYAKEDEMKRGIYLREYLALRRILQGK